MYNYLTNLTAPLTYHRSGKPAPLRKKPGPGTEQPDERRTLAFKMTARASQPYRAAALSMRRPLL